MAVNWNGAYKIVPPKHCAEEAAVQRQNEQWHLRFRPEQSAELIGNAEQRQAVHTWFQQPSTCTCIAVGGAVGTGKTSTVRICAAAAAQRLVHMDMNEGKTASVVEGLIRKARSENAVLFIDDVHRLATEGCTGLQSLLKALKSGGYVRLACCYDGSLLSNTKLSALLATAAQHVIFQPVPIPEVLVNTQRIARRAGGDLSYFDALFVSQKSRGDVRNALVRTEYLFNSRPALLQQNKKGTRILVDPGMCENGCLPDGETAAEMMIRGSHDKHKAADSAAAEGVRFARALHDKVHAKWLLHCDRSTEAETMAVIADALSESDVLLHPGLCDVEIADCARDAEQTEYEFRPQTATMVLAGALTAQQEAVQGRVRRIKKMKFSAF